jgi:hypothetical protein
MATIREVFNSDWTEGLAAAAYFMIQGRDAQILDQHEHVPQMSTAYDLGVRVKALNSDPRTMEYLNLLITEVALAYIIERTTSRSNPGGPYTLIGHASSDIIELGFIALICSTLDDFEAFTIFKEHNTLDKKIIKAINTASMDTTPADIETRSRKWLLLDEACVQLRAKAGL